MIAKDLDPFESTHEYEQAGQRALEQAANYLKTAFGNTKKRKDDIIVLNGLRLEAQRHGIYVDHLILYSQGFILVENRSRRADLEVNAIGEWTQTYKGALLRIPSPIQQAERKLRFLQQYLRKYGEGLPETDQLIYEYVITLPDEGSFKVPPGLQFSQVCRSHKLPKHIEALVQQHGGKGLFRRSDAEISLSREELLKISVFLRQNHMPIENRTVPAPKPKRKLPPGPPREHTRRHPEVVSSPLQPVGNTRQHAEARQAPAPVPQAPAPQQARTPQPGPSPLGSLYDMCQNCGEHYLQMGHHNGEFQYMCLNCEALTPVERDCPRCSQHRYIRRSGNEFFLECEHCLSSRLIYINPAN